MQLPPMQQRLAIEAPPNVGRGNRCTFHLTTNHYGDTYSEINRYTLMIIMREVVEEISKEENVPKNYGDYIGERSQ